jgi:hypothetical protein
VKPDIEVPAEEAFNAAYLKALEELRKGAPNSSEKALYQWYIDGYRTKIDPVIVDVARLLSFAGRYGSYTITFDEGVLYYQRGDRARHRLIPMSDALFIIEEIGNMRVRFILENDRVKGLAALYSDGERVEYERENDLKDE